EARTAASIQHPNVVDVNDFGKSDEGVFFLVMEYVEGESLYQLLRREGTLSVQRAQALLRQICAGVEAAHDEGILHRDLKPAPVHRRHYADLRAEAHSGNSRAQHAAFRYSGAGRTISDARAQEGSRWTASVGGCLVQRVRPGSERKFGSGG